MVSLCQSVSLKKNLRILPHIASPNVYLLWLICFKETSIYVFNLNFWISTPHISKETFRSLVGTSCFFIKYLWTSVIFASRIQIRSEIPVKNLWWSIFNETTLHKKWSFPLRISSVNKTKSSGNLVEKSLMKNFIFRPALGQTTDRTYSKTNHANLSL